MAAARRRVYLKEANREGQEMKDVPEIELEEVRQIFRSWGYEGKELEDLTKSIAKKPKAMLEFMMSYELDLAPVDKSEARRSALIVGSSTVFGSFIPLIPYLFAGAYLVFRRHTSITAACHSMWTSRRHRRGSRLSCSDDIINPQ